MRCWKPRNPSSPSRAGFEEDCARAVAEDDAGGAVLVIDDAAHHVRADDEDPIVGAGLDELRADGERVEKPAAGGGEIEAPGPRRAELVLDQAGGRGKHHVRGDGPDDDEIDVVRSDSPTVESLLGCRGGELRGARPGGGDAPLPDPGARHDPFVRRVDHCLQVVVAQDPVGYEPADGRDRGSSSHAFFEVVSREQFLILRRSAKSGQT